MNKFLLGLSLAAAAVPALAADVGVSIGINQPGLYGRVDIGRVAVPPVLVYERPLVIVQSPVAVQRQPIYLHVPPGHAQNWGRHCARYQACGQPVYFVQERWYRDAYAPVRHGKPDKRHHGDKKGHWKEDKRGHWKDDERGRGHGKHGRD